jgi:exodeoxyribonuclease V
MSIHRALVVEDERGMALEIGDLLQSMGYDHVCVDNLCDARRLIGKEEFCFVLLDLQIKPEKHSIRPRVEAGMTFLRTLREAHPRRNACDMHILPVIVVSGHAKEHEDAFARSQIARLELRLAHIHEPRFILNSQSLVRDCDLIVLDEVSMVGEEMANDLLAFGKPILVLGDPGQLPPIHGEGAFTNVAPDVMLDEIHRQAEGSAILRLATMARQGLAIDYGAYDEHVWKMPRRDVSPEQMLKGGQVLCGSNATRRGLNMSMKRAAGFMHDLPTGSGEKIICLKNRHDLGLINGMFLSLSDVHQDARNEVSFSATVQTEDGQEIAGRQHFWRGEYDDHIVFDRDRGRRDAQVRRTLVETSWGYAITVHKSQGSSWDNVVLFDDGFGRTAIDRNRWLYTAITRAEKGLVILS